MATPRAFRVSRSSPGVVPVIEATFPDYKGRKVRVVVTESVTLHDLNWGGGSRNVYRWVDLAEALARGQAAPTIGPSTVRFAPPEEGRVYSVPPGVVVVEHSYFQGVDGGITIYINPRDITPPVAVRWALGSARRYVCPLGGTGGPSGGKAPP
jgi:hypothetical protein